MNNDDQDISALDYWPTSGEPMYHYCPASAFWSICRNRTMWVSSIHTLNDSKELTWGREILNAVFAEYAFEFTPAFRFSLTRELFAPDGDVLPLIASFSREGDLLSQWRAYADDGAGFVIEFDASVLTDVMPVRMKEVLYDESRQMSLALNTIRSFYSWWTRPEPAAKLAVFKVLPEFAIDLVSYKHPTFFEEREVRAVHLVTRAEAWWADPGGHIPARGSVAGQIVLKRRRKGLDIPYVSLPIPDPRSISAVTLGPKNTLRDAEVTSELARIGLGHVTVRRSACSYR